jgi:hypothetical protein
MFVAIFAVVADASEPAAQPESTGATMGIDARNFTACFMEKLLYHRRG